MQNLITSNTKHKGGHRSMVKYEAEINGKKGDEFISADIIVYDDEDNKLGTIFITDESKFNELDDKINNFSSGYITEEQLLQILQNNDSSVTINATNIKGMNGGDFVEYIINQIKNNKDIPPRKHDSTTGEYGLGNKNSYGHVKTVNNLTSTGNYDGEALSAYQGRILNDKLETALKASEKLTELIDKHGLYIRLGRRRVVNGGTPAYEGTEGSRVMVTTTNPTVKDSIYVQLSCDKDGVRLENRKVNIIINGVGYEKTTDANGRAWVDINLTGSSSYFIVGVALAFDNFTNAYDIKNMVLNQ